MKNTTLAVLLFILTAGITFSQSKPVGNITETHNIAPDGSHNYMNQPISEDLSKLLKEVKKAKNDGDLAVIKYYQEKINNLTGAERMQITPITDVANFKGNDESDNFNYTSINTSHAVNSGAVTTDRATGFIYTAYTRNIIGLSDEIYVYKSVNNGLTWSEVTHFSFPLLSALDYTSNELDIEVINKGDSAYIWGIAGATLGSGSFSCVAFQLREDGTLFNAGYLNTGTPSLNYRYPRITSDYSRYSSGSYVYFMYTSDSSSASGKYVKSKYFYCPDPFSFDPTFVKTSNSPSGAYFYYTSNPSGDSTFMQNDICYLNTPNDSDFVCTSTIVRGNASFPGQSIFMTSSSTYGNSVDWSYNINDSRYLESPRVASGGYLSRNLMVGARKLFANGDWDAYYYYLRNISRNTANVSQQGYLDNTPDTTLTIDLKARYRSYDHFLFALADKNGTNGKAFVVGVQYKAGALQLPYIANTNNTSGTGTWGAPVASFRNINNDSCLIGWGNSTGFGYNVTGGSSGSLTGTGNNSMTPDNFSLGQNYPNPFNPTTKISFTIQQNSFAKLTIYDIMGGEITKLVDGQLTAGAHSVDFNASALPSGVYYYKLEANGFSDVKKMMLVK